MKILLFLVFIVNLCFFGFAAESIGQYKDPAHPGKCVLKNLILSPGQEAQFPNGCGRVLCGKDSIATIQTCAPAAPPRGCKYTHYINISAPYGKCCNRKLVC